MDMGAFKDDDGSAYVVFSNSNARISIYKLASDYLSVASKTCDIGSSCEEAPAIIKANGRYFLTNSWCTYWSANQNHYRSATSIAGPWSANPNGNLGDGTTFNSQGGFIFPVTGASGTTYIYIGDRWDCPQNACDLSMSKYVWLPLTISGSTMLMAWYDTWYLDIQKGTWSLTPTSTAGNPARFAAKAPSPAAIYDIQGRVMKKQAVAGAAGARKALGARGILAVFAAGNQGGCAASLVLNSNQRWCTSY
jgi:hypothetical protein